MSSVQTRTLAETHGVATEADGGVPHRVDADMRHVLEVLAAMEPRPLHECGVEEARLQPGPASALSRILKAPPDDSEVGMELRLLPGAGGDMRARIYTPLAPAPAGGRPMILYLHGGGWVVGDLEHYDPTPRMLARRTGAVVVAVHYRQAPEHRFPAAHKDSFAAWCWMQENAAALGGDAANAAVAGEGSGANMALNLALTAREEGVRQPRHQLLICPMAGTDFTLPSYLENADSRPLSSATVQWFYRKALRNRAALEDPRLNLYERHDLAGLPPATIILAEIDPLRSEGELLAQALRRSGVWVDMTVYEGVTHQFFSLGALVNKAMFAQGQAARNLSDALVRRAEPA
ncbi:MAG TPA: alpha/beta hydrolase [Devosiaceae bacterium]|jgi:acetyl esterase/lipase|nr:alpha/beta hydrolase [Devosiaceae bacterium]